MTKSAVKSEDNITPNLGVMLATIGYALSKLNMDDRKQLTDGIIALSEEKFKNYKKLSR